MTYLLLAEKPSAARNFAQALGGMSGTFNGQKYQIHALFGHMLTYAEPHDMVSDEHKQTFKSWAPETMPWDTSLLSWQKVPQVSKNTQTGKMQSKAGAIQDLIKATQGISAIVIATDKDPSGEGQLIGWEVIQAINWKGPVKRLYFVDESTKALQDGFKNIVDLPHYDQDGEYVKADVRSRWDFVSMQLTRLATHAARAYGFDVAVVRQGRLKSVMTKLVADQLALVNAYKKKPYFEVKFKDDNGNVFSRAYEEDIDTFRFEKEADAKNDMASYRDSTVVEDAKVRKETPPGKLLDLGALAAILGTKGYKAKDVLSTYQKMYEAKIVSYPRTEDTFISKEQFNEMLPLVDQIASVVGADTSLLTHRQARKTHVKDGGAHGANRPGLVVPASLDALSAKYGALGAVIYETLAKNFLAMFGENYVYDAIKGHIKDYPKFIANVSVPVSLGFKAIFDAEKETADDDAQETVSKGLGSTGSPFVAEGVNKKPQHPSHKWLEKQLNRYDVGTGATRVSTLSDVTTGKTALLTDTRGKLTLTETGQIAAILLQGARIADPKVTEKLFKAMRNLGTFTAKPEDVMQTVTDLVIHDKDVFYSNAKTLVKRLGQPTAPARKEKVEGVYAPTGEMVSFSKEWSGHTFTDDEVKRLLAGEEITITAITKLKKQVQVKGSLGQGVYNKRSYWGFMRNKDNTDTIDTAPFPAEWSGYTFTKGDEQRLRAGEKISITAISGKTKKPFDVEVSFSLRTYNGSTFWGIEPHFKERPAATAYTRETAPFKPEFSGYKLTQEEIDDVRAGEKILVTAKSKKGKDFTCTVSLELDTYNGVTSWRLVPQFD